jgi:predicted anti-sigma-YlaC factor YlaD
MRTDHDKARELIALGESISDADGAWLRTHLHECDACRDYGDGVNTMIRALRTVPLAADARLVRATQMRVRFHARRLREARERMWLVGTICFAVGLSATVSAPVLWRLFAWLGEQAGVSPVIWQAAFVCFGIAPVLVVSVFFLARGTHLAGGSDRSQPWK